MADGSNEILYEQRGAAAWLTLNRPEALNSLTWSMLGGLRDGLARAEADPEVCCLVVTGAGRGFCAGTDLAVVRGSEGGFDLRGFLVELRDALLEIEESPLPVIAAVNGVACAGGLELVLACDLVLAAQEARMGDAHANFGLVPGGGGSVRLPERVGLVRAKRLLLTGELLPAATLAEWGLVNEVVPGDGLDAAVTRLAELLATRSPLAAARAKRLADAPFRAARRAALDAEIEEAVAHGASADVAEGLAAFVEKRTPRFTGR